MKLAKTVTFFLFLLSSFLQTNGQTKRETLDWIRDKILANSKEYNDILFKEETGVILFITKYTIYEVIDDFAYGYHNEAYEINIKNINVSNCKFNQNNNFTLTSIYSNLFNVYISTSKYIRAKEYSSKNYDNGYVYLRKYEDQSKTAIYTIEFSDGSDMKQNKDNLKDRFVKALTKLCELYGVSTNKKEVF